MAVIYPIFVQRRGYNVVVTAFFQILVVLFDTCILARFAVWLPHPATVLRPFSKSPPPLVFVSRSDTGDMSLYFFVRTPAPACRNAGNWQCA